MFHIVHPKKDTTIYSHHPCMNVGLDEVLELNVVPGPAVVNPICANNPDKYTYEVLRDDNGDPILDENGEEQLINGTDYSTAKNGIPTVGRYGVQYQNTFSHRSRILLYFDVTKIVEYFERYRARFIEEYGLTKWHEMTTPENQSVYKCYLRLWSTDSYEIPTTYDIEAYPVKARWSYWMPYEYDNDATLGPGRKFNRPSTSTGATWIYSDTDAGERWQRPGLLLPPSGYPDNYDTSEVPSDDYEPSVDAKQHFHFEDPDVFMDVTDLFDYWVSDEYQSDPGGMIVRRSDENAGRFIELKFFGTNSHTIFVPELVFAYDDQYWYLDEQDVNAIQSPSQQLVFNSTEDLTVRVSNLLPMYRSDSVARFRVNIDIKQAEKQFIEEKVYEDKFVGRMPQYIHRDIGTIQYSVIDKVAEKTVVPFSEFSKLSLDPDGYYFDLDLTGYFPERFYKIIFRYEDYIDGYSYVYDNNETFKVIK